MKRAICIVALLINMTTLYAGQLQPDAKRVKQIQTALQNHDYQPGKNWPETKEILKQIAREHQWQTQRVPDARVLILLGLGNQHSDPYVATQGHNHLDGGNDEAKN